MSHNTDEVDRLIEDVRRGKKYRRISETLIAHIGAKEIAKRSSHKEAVKSTRNKLHQVGGLYFEQALDYPQLIKALLAAEGKGDAALRRQALQIMGQHTSTRERIPILEPFYAKLMGTLPSPNVILDVACGLNPLALPWMGLDPGVQYFAFDIYADLVEFLDEVIDLYHYTGSAQVQDVVHDPPSRPADLALVLKSLPCLEQIEKGAGRMLLKALNARYLAVSYPVQSVGGKVKGMVENYEAQFEETIAGLRWHVQRIEFDTELIFVIDKG